MQEEIKEILYMLKSVIDNPEETFCANATTCYLLLDYITNLQEENERLKIEYRRLADEDAWEIADYKLRNEKAIEYIEKLDSKTTDMYEICETSKNELLNILQGVDKE